MSVGQNFKRKKTIINAKHLRRLAAKDLSFVFEEIKMQGDFDDSNTDRPQDNDGKRSENVFENKTNAESARNITGDPQTERLTEIREETKMQEDFDDSNTDQPQDTGVQCFENVFENKTNAESPRSIIDDPRTERLSEIQDEIKMQGDFNDSNTDQPHDADIKCFENVFENKTNAESARNIIDDPRTEKLTEIRDICQRILQWQKTNFCLLNNKLDDLSERISVLENWRNGQNQDLQNAIEKFLPLCNGEDLHKFENELEIDEFFSTAVLVVKKVGSTDLKRSIGGIMKKIMTDDLAEKFSVVGHKGKNSFKKLKTWTVLTQAVREYHPNITDEIIGKQLGFWLAQAKTRINRRSQNNVIIIDDE